ncbi:hypothetical protein OESDEN_10042 [Oesophagostomum dentatum]|uniref:Uncharacterized protein n=1 Tax=Oesophagostomum dentatum TaxID=61180 RepID=A0A0B1SYS8_OESDE|nr:hypothetical protein OESDEN_10042 [Oesophagostomum dentatum]
MLQKLVFRLWSTKNTRLILMVGAAMSASITVPRLFAKALYKWENGAWKYTGLDRKVFIPRTANFIVGFFYQVVSVVLLIRTVQVIINVKMRSKKSGHEIGYGSSYQCSKAGSSATEMNGAFPNPAS